MSGRCVQRLVLCSKLRRGHRPFSTTLKRQTGTDYPTLRPPTWFFSSNATSEGIATLPPELEQKQLLGWRERERTVTQKKLETSSSRLLRPPDDPPAFTPIEYPPSDLSIYKPVPALTPRRLLRVYTQLSKLHLTSFVVITSMAGVALSPLPATVPVLLSTALGTALCSAAANTINQVLEIPFDAQMARTRNRPLVRRAISPLHAIAFAAVTGFAGPTILFTLVNPITAILGALNIVLYSGVYTLMKRRSTWNTWVGAVVGGLPPLMGWTACGGHILPSSSYPVQTFLPPFMDSLPSLPLDAIDNPLSTLALFTLLFSWQFPHFNGLSHLLRASYAQAGYQMLCVTAPSHNALVALRHSILLTAVCSILVPLSGLTTWAFALTSLPFNVYAIRVAVRFWREGTDKAARVVFQYSLWYLPAILGLMMFHKQGIEWLQWMGWSSTTEEPIAVAMPLVEGRVSAEQANV